MSDDQATLPFVRYVEHGADIFTTRPSTPGIVIWVGIARPVNLVSGDLWCKSLPSTLPDLEAWYDAADTSTITNAGAGAVSAWNDRSVHARHITQGTAGNRPVTGTTTVNGKNVIVFTTDYLRGNLLYVGNARTTYCVVVPNTHDASRRTILESGPIGGANLNYSQVSIELNTANKLSAFTVNNAGGAARNIVSADVVPAAVASVFTRTVQGDGFQTIFQNGKQVGIQAIVGTLLQTASQITVGANRTPANYWKGSIAEILDFSGVHTAGQLAGVHAYLLDKWGIT